jgi:leader peptidase (prepilin peptidase)/N-methyltransferase
MIVAWAAAGVIVGVVLAACYRRLLTSTPASLQTVRFTTPLLTAIAFGILAWRFGSQFDLVPYSVLAALGVTLSLIDLIEQRLPSVLIYFGIALLGALLATSTLLESRWPDFLRALAGLAVLAGFYLILALASGGGLGAGDVKLGGLLGLALGWSSWSALITATFVGWCLAAMAWLILRATRRRPQGSPLPLGPFLLVGAVLTINVMPT